MSHKLNGGGQERASQVLGGHFQICNLGPKSASVSPKTALQPAKNGQMREMVATLHMQLDFPVSKSPLTP